MSTHLRIRCYEHHTPCNTPMTLLYNAFRILLVFFVSVLWACELPRTQYCTVTMRKAYDVRNLRWRAVNGRYDRRRVRVTHPKMILVLSAAIIIAHGDIVSLSTTDLSSQTNYSPLHAPITYIRPHVVLFSRRFPKVMLRVTIAAPELRPTTYHSPTLRYSLASHD